jgi:hypothetical protein
LEPINKEIIDIKIVNAGYSSELCVGTIVYGTLFYYAGFNETDNQQRFFSIEDIFIYKGIDVGRSNWGEKYQKIEHIMKNDIQQITKNGSFVVFGLPIITKTHDKLKEKISKIGYNIDSIQYKQFNRANNFLFMKYFRYVSETKATTATIATTATTATTTSTINATTIKSKFGTLSKIEQYLGLGTEKSSKPNLRESMAPSRKDVIFDVRPDIQNDVYNLYCANDEPHGIASIPDYKTSKMMNELFRIIKENKNLDALEESDDEDEFEDGRADRFVDIKKSCKMICAFNHKFKKWTPLRLAHETSDIISRSELDLIYKGHDNNRRQKYVKY